MRTKAVRLGYATEMYCHELLRNVIQGLGKDAFTKRHSTEEQRGGNVDGLDWNER